MRKYKKGEKVVIRKDLVVGEVYGGVHWSYNMEVLQNASYVVIEHVNEVRSYKTNYDVFVSDEMIEGLYKGDKKYVWYLDSEDGTYFLNNLLGVDKWHSHEIEEIKNGKDACYLLTEEEGRKSPFFDKFAKYDPLEEKWYYIRMKGNEKEYLNFKFNDGNYFMDDNEEHGLYKTKFTEKEANEIIGTSTILYKEEC